MKIIQRTLIALSGNFALCSAVEAQGRLSNEANQAVTLASKLSSVLNSELEKSFGNVDLATLPRREETCAAVAKSIQFDGELVDDMLAANSALPDNNTPRYMYRDIYSARAILAAGAAEYRLDRADAYLKFSCLDQADSLYREVIKIFVGSSFDAYRARATIGIEDVRSRRQSTE